MQHSNACSTAHILVAVACKFRLHAAGVPPPLSLQSHLRMHLYQFICNTSPADRVDHALSPVK